MIIDISPFMRDITKIMTDKCIHCKRDIFIGVLILGNKTMRDLLSSIQVVSEALSSGNQILGGQRVHRADE
jgi:hypothetical protein